MIFAASTLAVLPLSLALVTPTAHGSGGAPQQLLRGRDCLRYACDGCGCSWTAPMRDQELADARGTAPSRGGDFERRRISLLRSAPR